MRSNDSEWHHHPAAALRPVFSVLLFFPQRGISQELLFSGLFLTFFYSSHVFSLFSFGNRQKKCRKHLDDKAPEGAGMIGLRVEEEEQEGRSGGGKEREAGRGGRGVSLLDSAQRLHLEGLSVGAPLSVMFVLATMTVTLHDVLVTTVTWKLVAHPAGGGGGGEGNLWFRQLVKWNAFSKIYVKLQEEKTTVRC